MNHPDQRESKEPIGDDWRKPDAFERRLRCGCGFVFGVVGAGVWVLKEVADPGWPALLVVAGIGVIVALLAVRYGDRFWHAVLEMLGD
jgi:hypothetical protein